MKIIFSILSWGGLQLFYNILRNSDLKKWDEILKAVLFFLILVIISIVLPVSYGIQFDFPDMFLFSCISACPLAITGKVLIPFFRTIHRCCTFQTLISRFFQVSYIIVTLGCMGTAVWIFTAKATTDKTLTADRVIWTRTAQSWISLTKWFMAYLVLIFPPDGILFSVVY